MDHEKLDGLRKLSEGGTGEGILTRMNDYPSIRERLILRPFHYLDCWRELRSYVYERQGDLALVLSVVICEKEGELRTTRVPRSVFEGWKLKKAGVWEEVMRNTCILAPPRLYGSLDEPLALTTEKRGGGAVAVFYPGMKEKLSRLLGGNYFVVFGSVHEAFIYREKDTDPAKMLKSLKRTNQSLGPGELLSRKVFYYNQKDHTLKAMQMR